MVQLSDYTHQVVSNNNGNHLNPMLLLTSLVPVSTGQIEMGSVCQMAITEGEFFTINFGVSSELKARLVSG